METPIDMYNSSDHEQSRKQVGPTIMARLHVVPKKVSDTAQTQGLSEKFLEQGQMSGFIHPSVLAHDRYLSIMDAVKDAIVITALLFFIPMFSLNWFTGTLAFLVIAYWFFHVAWWEKTQSWKIKASVIKYVNNTYTAYWVVFLFLMIPAGVMLWYSIFTMGVEVMAFKGVDFVLMLIGKAESALANVFGHIEFVRQNLSAQAHYAVSIDSVQYEKRFMIIGGIFIGLTVFAKLLFGHSYKNDCKFHARESEKELDYAGEAALRTIRGARNAA